MPQRLEARVRQRRFRSRREAAFVGLLVVGEHLRVRLEAVCERHGITHTQYNLLRILRGAPPEGHPRYEIANRLVSRAPDVTRLLDRLDRLGFIERGWAPDNRRLSVARITDEGRALLAAVDPEIAALQDETLGALTGPQVESLVGILDVLTP
ncbi:MarR family winged helix-turn-helix transcriptional regulator [Luteitalea sp. TBR-22]|uniref:MarR family winged helix-turn-helix transcriptional regulator n=1 Tax=Luteitalea sp. TBR-22 TaxID=2802971 RepID=UPI001EF456F7|nr:MarR family transcriptional regulator [Luteitalea sp. TBR-22]